MNPSVLAPVFSSVYCCVFFLAGGGKLYLVSQLEVRKDGAWKSLGESFLRVRGGKADKSAMTRSSDLSSDQAAIQAVNEGGQVTVTITTSCDEKVLRFDREFLRSGDRKVTVFRTEEGAEYRVTHFGERDCEVEEEAPQLRVVRSSLVQPHLEASAAV